MTDLTPAEQIVRDALGETDAKTYNGVYHDLDDLARATVAKLADASVPSESVAPGAPGTLLDVLGNAVYEAGVGRAGPDPTWKGVAEAATRAARAWFDRRSSAPNGDLAGVASDVRDVVQMLGGEFTPDGGKRRTLINVAERLDEHRCAAARTLPDEVVGTNKHGDIDLIDEAWSLLTEENRDDAWEAARDRWGIRYGQAEPPRGGPDRARLLEEMWRRRTSSANAARSGGSAT